MIHLPVSGLPFINEDEAEGEIARLFDEGKREFRTPFVPNMLKALAGSPGTLGMLIDTIRAFYQHITLPESLVAMIWYTVAERKNCHYCAAGNELACRSLGIDDDTIACLAKDLSNLSPERIRVTIDFAFRVAQNPQELVAEDYDRLREQGISDDEIMQIIMVVAVGNLGDTLADALKIDIDAVVAAELGRA